MDFLVAKLYPDGIYCPKCGRITSHYRVRARTCYECQFCGHQEYPLVGTIFERSSKSLRLWFQAMYLMASTRCGISAKQLEREIGVSYPTAWRMFKVIRSLLDQNGDGPLSGHVEVDETWVGEASRWPDQEQDGARQVDDRAHGARGWRGRAWWASPGHRDGEHPQSDGRSVRAEHAIGFVVVAGFPRIVGTETVQAYEDRIVKVHHSLLPEFPGPDPVADALELGVKETGVTVHLINRELEAGPIVSQQALEVRDGENWHSLTQRLHQLEMQLLPAAVRTLVEGRRS
jgi:transposase-like protein